MNRFASLLALVSLATAAGPLYSAHAEANNAEGEEDTWPAPPEREEDRDARSAPRGEQDEDALPAPTPRESNTAARGSAALSPLQAMAIDILRWTNVERLANGLPAFAWSPVAARAAVGHSDEMMRLGYFSHTSPNARNRDPLRRAQNAGLRGDSLAVGENIAWGDFDTRDARSIVRMWMESPGHRRNILDRTFRYLGVGVGGHSGKLWSTQVFSASP